MQSRQKTVQYRVGYSVLYPGVRRKYRAIPDGYGAESKC